MPNVENRNIGDRLTPEWTYSVSGTPTDPTQIVVQQQEPDGTETTISTASSPGTLTTSSTPLARVSAGVFKLNPGTSADEPGYWIFTARATGTAESGPPDFVYKVLPSEIGAYTTLGAQALVSLQEAKDWLNEVNIEAGDELELAETIDAVSVAVINEAGREFKTYSTTSTESRLFTVDFDAYWNRSVFIGDLATLNTVEFLDKDGALFATIAAGDIVSYPRNRKPWEPITRLEFTADAVRPVRYNGSIRVTGTWGFPSVPADIKRAVLEGVVAQYDRQVESYRTELGAQTGGEGQNVVVFAGRPQLLDLPPKTLGTARRYQESQVG